MRKIIALLVGSVLAVTGVLNSPVSASARISPDVTELGLDLRENSELGRTPTVLGGTSNPSDPRTYLLCQDVNDSICTSSTDIIGQVNLDLCSDISTLDCVSNVWAVDSSGHKIQGVFLKRMPEDSRYNVDENVKANLPRSHGVGGIWRFPGVLNSAGLDTYFVSVQDSVGIRKAAGQTIINAGGLGTGSIIAGILPVQEVTGSYQLLSAIDAAHGGIGFGSNGTEYAPDQSPCAAVDLTTCEAIREFPSNYRFGMTINFGQKRSGWFHGRFHNPSISTSAWKSGESVSIEAEPVLVPSLNFVVPNSQIPDSVKKLIATGINLGMKGDGINRTQISENLSGPVTLKLVSDFAPAYNNTATHTNSYWSFKTLNENSDQIQKCAGGTSDLAGLVTTNALAYSAGPPSFDASSGSLLYKVASPHYQADGKVAVGTYDLSIRSDVARCIYGFSKAPIHAEVSVISQDGVQQVATTSLNEKDGWLYLTANGFNYSNPTISVKFTQEVSVSAPTASPSPSVSAVGDSSSKESAATSAKSPANQKKITITCIKGKITKSLTAVKPTCPAGYKKK